jgi:hypothetical protein
MLKKEAREITGGLSKPSKMPGPAHNLPAVACKTGAKLVKVPGSVCAGCYALKGRYRFNNVQAALDRRLQALQDPRWVDAMVQLIKGQDWFRWHDSGDIQSMEHLKNIFKVCKQTPETKHWMPTREAQFLKQLDPATIPPNLIIRMSSHMIDQGPVQAPSDKHPNQRTRVQASSQNQQAQESDDQGTSAQAHGPGCKQQG